MNIEDFLPKYPNINKSEYDILNTYDTEFNDTIFRKKEFYDERLDEVENLPSEKGTLMKHQKIISRFLSSHTMYDELLLIHEMGSGKTCSAIGAIEEIKRESKTIKGAYIFAGGETLLNNFVKELRDKCTAGEYVPEGHIVDGESKLSEGELKQRSRKLFETYYHIKFGEKKHTTFQLFAKHLSELKDNDIVNMYSNNIIVIDEVHNLREYEYEDGNEKIGVYNQFHRFLHLVKNSKILLLSGTPMNSYFILTKYEFFLI